MGHGVAFAWVATEPEVLQALLGAGASGEDEVELFDIGGVCSAIVECS